MKNLILIIIVTIGLISCNITPKNPFNSLTGVVVCDKDSIKFTNNDKTLKTEADIKLFVDKLCQMGRVSCKHPLTFKAKNIVISPNIYANRTEAWLVFEARNAFNVPGDLTIFGQFKNRKLDEESIKVYE